MCRSFVPGLDKTKMAVRTLDLCPMEPKIQWDDSVQRDSVEHDSVEHNSEIQKMLQAGTVSTLQLRKESILYEWHLQKNKPGWKSGSFSRFSPMLRLWASEGPVHGLLYSLCSDHWNWSVFLDVTLIGNEIVKHLSAMKFSQILTFCFLTEESDFVEWDS